MSKRWQPRLPNVMHEMKEYCQHHQVEIIQYFCRDHSALVCSSCVSADHRSCKNDYIPEVSKNYEKSSEYKNMLHNLEIMQENCKMIAKKTEENVTKITQNQDDIRKELKKLCKDIRDMIDKWEKELDSEVVDLFKEDVTKTKSIEKECDKVTAEIATLKDDLKTLQTSKKNNELFIRVKKFDIKNHITSVCQMAENNIICDVEFKPNASVNNMLKLETCLGELVRNKKEDIIPLKEVNKEEIDEESKKDRKRWGALFDTLTATLSGKINIKIPSDKNAYNITGIAVIASETLAVADFINNIIKIVDAKQQKVVSNVKLSSGPWDVALLPEEELAVTLPDEHKIHILSLANGLTQIRQVKVGGYCYGLAYSDKKFVVTLHTFPAKVQIMTLEGEVLKTMKFDDSGKGLFVFPWYVSVSGIKKHIYVTDADKKDLKYLDLEGEVKAVYKDSKLSCTFGISVLVDGTVMVCSYNNNTIHLVSSDFNKGRVMLQNKDGIQDPRCLAVDWAQRKLYIGCYQNVNLQVFDLK